MSAVSESGVPAVLVPAVSASELAVSAVSELGVPAVLAVLAVSSVQCS